MGAISEGLKLSRRALDGKETSKYWTLQRVARLLFLIALGSGQAADADQILLSAQIGGDIQRTRYVAFLSKKVEYRIFSIADPYRIVVDLPEVDIQVPAEKGRGLILSSRSGLFAAGKSRHRDRSCRAGAYRKVRASCARKRASSTARHRADAILAQGVSRRRQNSAADPKGRREPERRRHQKCAR